MDQQYAKAKAEAIEAAKNARQNKKPLSEFIAVISVQAWLKDRSNGIGSWWAMLLREHEICLFHRT